VTGQLAALLFLSILMCPPEPSGEKWKQFGLRNIFILLHAVNLLYFPSEGSGAPDFYHP
jgi:hypothetical protein